MAVHARLQLGKYHYHFINCEELSPLSLSPAHSTRNHLASVGSRSLQRSRPAPARPTPRLRRPTHVGPRQRRERACLVLFAGFSPNRGWYALSPFRARNELERCKLAEQTLRLPTRNYCSISSKAPVRDRTNFSTKKASTDEIWFNLNVRGIKVRVSCPILELGE